MVVISDPVLLVLRRLHRLHLLLRVLLLVITPVHVLLHRCKGLVRVQRRLAFPVGEGPRKEEVDRLGHVLYKVEAIMSHLVRKH